MITYTDIPDSDIDPESPGTTSLFVRLRDNPLSIVEGQDPSAPKIKLGALDAQSVPYTAIVQPTTAGTPAVVVWRYAGNATDVHSSALVVTSNYVWSDFTPNHIGLRAIISGSVIVSVELMGSSGGNADLNIYKNGSLQFTLTDATSAGVWSTAKVGLLSFSAGDLITLSLGVSGGETQANMRDLKMLADTFTFCPFV